jgi:hypothetical protein
LRNPIGGILELYGTGGIEILTYDGGAGQPPGGSAVILARTVIQPDADVISFISSAVLDRPEVWQAHIRRVNGQTASLRRFRGVLRWSGLVSLVPLAWGSYNLAVSVGGYGLWGGGLAFTALGFSVGPLMLVLKPLVVFSLRGLIQRALR